MRVEGLTSESGRWRGGAVVLIAGRRVDVGRWAFVCFRAGLSGGTQLARARWEERTRDAFRIMLSALRIHVRSLANEATDVINHFRRR